ncbi:uncharacterized protein ACLA_087830 [Aspergillus clavatus NRRL 1]|uniref:Uncharacterized protein n=1 Tax=Aspergillus clavatus (strain ATCC 1007 / CBS 513.65 / DSM 816 / NCTC 3887 / NRRL 1 / QM 1276 / 107) TaxID=344612 RepID=A1CUT9_ASPCL|nr:uncharacterized protein ACLA_087830 [Aspergillus clavatus NRRL 1]EAW07076.1 conserved hypothetical protein [Aspergillus clavatus NRRL 1]
MAWKEIRPGHWERPLGESEGMIKMIGDGGKKIGKDIWCISITARFTAHLDNAEGDGSLTTALRRGWKLLRFHHPSIATTVREDTARYDVPDCLALERWVSETFIVVHGEVHPDDLIAQLPPRPLATVHYLEHDSSLVLQLSHWRTDGIGALHLLNAYFEAVVDALQQERPDTLPWGEEVSRLVPSVEEALGLPSTPTPEAECAAQKYLDTLAHYRDALSTPYRSGGNIAPGATRSVHRACSVAETTQLEAECRRQGLVLAAAVHAAVTTTAYDIADPALRRSHHSTTMRQSLRPNLPAPYNGPGGAASLYTAGYVVKVPPSQSWSQYAKQYDAEYRRGATAELLSSRRHYSRVMKALLQKGPSPNPPPSGLDISYIPDAAALVASVHTNPLGKMEISSIGIRVEVVSRHMYVFGWVFNGRLELHLVYNESFYHRDMAENTVAHVQKNLFSNLRSHSS